MTRIFSVSEITQAVAQTLEPAFPFVWVRGQVSNLARPASGHLYFTLKDDKAAINVVWFKSRRLFSGESHDPLTGEVLDAVRPLELANGLEILCGGPIRVYPPRGGYQISAELVQEVGQGKLHQEFEALKLKLREQGWFDSERKRPLPAHPQRVGVVTAVSGAAVRDFLRLAGERGFGAQIRIYPTLVQGAEAPKAIARAMDILNEQGWAEVAVLIRGGGSLEDLWAFNTEETAGAVHRSDVPVLAGIGHEVDFTIADMVADVRAATPSHAAQMLWPEKTVLAQRIDSLEIDLARVFSRLVQRAESGLGLLEKGLAWLSPLGRLDRLGHDFAGAEDRLILAFSRFMEGGKERLDSLVRELDRSMGPDYFERRLEAVQTLESRLDRAARELERTNLALLDMLDKRLDAADPAAPLARGYCLVRKRKDGRALTRISQCEVGDDLDIEVVDGRIGARVGDVEPKETA